LAEDTSAAARWAAKQESTHNEEFVAATGFQWGEEQRRPK